MGWKKYHISYRIHIYIKRKTHISETWYNIFYVHCTWNRPLIIFRLQKYMEPTTRKCWRELDWYLAHQSMLQTYACANDIFGLNFTSISLSKMSECGLDSPTFPSRVSLISSKEKKKANIEHRILLHIKKANIMI